MADNKKSSRKSYSGRFRPRNPQKYKGNVHNIIWRSTYELKLMRYCDLTESVLEWSSEEHVIPYVNPIDNRRHRYFVDIYIKRRNKDGTIQKLLIEVKPKNQTIMPKKPQRITKRYISEVQTYVINQAKWQAASAWAKENGMVFKTFTEQELGIR